MAAGYSKEMRQSAFGRSLAQTDTIQSCQIKKDKCLLSVPNTKIKSPTLQRQFRLYIPFLGIAWPQPQFPHLCVCERFLYSQDRSTYFLQQKRQTHRRNIQFAHRHMNLEIGTETPLFLFWEYLFQIFGILSLQCILFICKGWENICIIFIIFVLSVACFLSRERLMYCGTSVSLLSFPCVGQCKTNKGLSADSLSV